MAYRRPSAPITRPAFDELTSNMVGIGILLAAEGAAEPNIEDTLFFGAAAGFDHDDFRTLSLIAQWLDVHAAWLNADRLLRLVCAASIEDARHRAFWAGLSAWKRQDARFKRFEKLADGSSPLLRVGNEFQLARRGEDPRFANGPLRVAAGTLRTRPGDILQPAELVRRHTTYRCRVQMGPSYRADMWAALEQDGRLPPAELARRTYGSFATAWQTKRDWELIQPVAA